VSVRDRYEAISKRSFKSALIQLLEREYKVLGSHKVLAMLADDIDRLYREFYPDRTKLSVGELVLEYDSGRWSAAELWEEDGGVWDKDGVFALYHRGGYRGSDGA